MASNDFNSAKPNLNALVVNPACAGELRLALMKQRFGGKGGGYACKAPAGLLGRQSYEEWDTAQEMRQRVCTAGCRGGSIEKQCANCESYTRRSGDVNVEQEKRH
ncbi:hypothetical protein B0H16DRAFT_1446350 [Mycena metata]|uniref:Uncharacterized protein n=1 Tax=Mycena metata TaxID=1033252 RepID=A0AAD7P373_9AGAR|nr:hypothetical protein B0H16DRAFT_1446350 [Mycena metata]